MSSTYTQPINVIEVLPAIYTVAPPTQRQINELVSWVRSEGRLDYYTASMALESRVIKAALKQCVIVETQEGFLALPVVEQAPAAPAAQISNAPENAESCIKSDIDQQINQLANSNDPAFRQAASLYNDCLSGDWLDHLVAELEQESQGEETNMDTLEIPNMKCKNLDREDPYWFFVGSRNDAFFAIELLAQDGIYTTARPNGQTGCYAVKVPRWVRGKLVTVEGRQESQAA